MLDSKKLLYIFSDVAYVTELLPAKKQGDFTLQNFRQINGEYLNNDVFIVENIAKLFAKLEKEEYVLILPDFFFTNTIIEIGEKAKTKIDKQITEELFPSLGLSPQTHQLQHFVLTQYGEKSNVQLSAIEKSLLAPIYESASANEVKITKVVSLSWTIKALVSLEPSLSLIQMGENLYLVQHYIGVDQATSAPVTDVEKIAETVKTLRGVEPSIQTMYLLTNELVEKKIEELLNKTLPTQQLTDFSEENPEVPPYVRQIIEAGVKTLSIADFNVPAFNVEKVDPELVVESAKKQEDSVGGSDDNEIIDSDPLPAPTPHAAASTTSAAQEVAKVEPKIEVTSVSVVESAALETSAGVAVETIAETISLTKTDLPAAAQAEPKINLSQVGAADEAGDDAGVGGEPASKTEAKSSGILGNMQDDKSQSDEALSRFAMHEDKAKSSPEPKTAEPVVAKTDKAVIKNKTGVNSMLRMIFVSVAVFFLTVGIGVGLGISYLTVSQQASPSPTPVVTATASPTPAAETVQPTASPAAALKPDEISLLVVNATSKAGYAGSIKKLLTTAEFSNVDTGNAKGDYEDGNYLLMSEENLALKKLVEEATKLTFTYSSEIRTEDLKGSYDAVLVLNE